MAKTSVKTSMQPGNNPEIWAQEKFQDSFEFMDPVRKVWRYNETLYQGVVDPNVFHNNNEAGTQINSNKILSIIETELPVVINNIPSADIIPTHPNDVLTASIVDKTKKDLEEKGGLMGVYESTALDQKIYSNGLFSHFPILNKGTLAGIDYTPVDIMGWFPSRDSVDLDITQSSSYQCFAVVMPLEVIKRTYKKGNEVRPEDDLNKFRGYSRDRTNKKNQTGKTNEALVKQIYFVDDDLDTYPTGRVITWANGILLEDAQIYPVARKDLHESYKISIPYKMVKNHGSVHKLFGRGEPEILESMTQSADEVKSAMADNIRNTGNPTKVMSERANAEGDVEWTGAPNELLIGDLNDFNTLPAQSQPNSSFNFVAMLNQDSEDATGASKSLRGEKEAGIESGRAIIALQQQSLSRLEAQTHKEYRSVVKELNEFEVWAIKQFAKQTVIREEGMTQATQELQSAKNENVKVTEAGGFVFTEINFEELLKDSKFDIRIEEGQSLPKGSLARFELALQMLELGLIDGKEVLAASPMEDKPRLIAEFEQRQQADGIRARLEASENNFKQFASLVAKSNSFAEQEPPMTPEDYANTVEAMNISDLIEQFPEYMKSNEWHALNIDYKDIVLNVFKETPQEDEELAGKLQKVSSQ